MSFFQAVARGWSALEKGGSAIFTLRDVARVHNFLKNIRILPISTRHYLGDGLNSGRLEFSFKNFFQEILSILNYKRKISRFNASVKNCFCSGHFYLAIHL